MATISERVLAHLEEHSGTPVEIAKALNISKRNTALGYTYNWGHWSFARAEKEVIIEWKDGKWHLVKTSET